MFWLLQALPLVSLWSSLLANKIYIFLDFDKFTCQLGKKYHNLRVTCCILQVILFVNWEVNVGWNLMKRRHQSLIISTMTFPTWIRYFNWLICIHVFNQWATFCLKKLQHSMIFSTVCRNTTNFGLLYVFEAYLNSGVILPFKMLSQQPQTSVGKMVVGLVQPHTTSSTWQVSMTTKWAATAVHRANWQWRN